MNTAFLVLLLAQQAGNGSWTDKAPLPDAPASRVILSTGGLLYLAGSPPTARDAVDFYAYSPLTDSWSVRNGIRSQGFDYWGAISGSTWNGDLAIFGNYLDANGVVIGTTVAWHYAPAADSWTREADCPIVLDARAAEGPASIYLAGGWDYDPAVGSVSPFFEFDGAWTRRANLPALIPQSTVGFVDGKLIVTGTTWAGALVTWIFDGTAWSNGATPPAAGYHSTVVGPRLYVLGGYFGGWPPPPNVPMLEYNGVSDTWLQRTGPGDTSMWVAAAGADDLHVYCTDGYQRFMRFEPPDYGVAPDAPTSVATAPWNNGTALFTATVTDPDIDQVRLQVEMNGAQYTGPLSPEGTVGVSATLPQGHYAWRCRAIDWNDNASVWVDGPEFDVDTTAPSQVPVAVSPVNRYGVPHASGGAVQFVWTGLVADGGAPIGVEIQVARDPGFASLVTSAELPLGFYYWRVRAVDAAGNVAPQWSNVLAFEVWWDDAVDHGGGDGCGMSATASTSTRWLMVLFSGWVCVVLRRGGRRSR